MEESIFDKKIIILIIVAVALATLLISTVIDTKNEKGNLVNIAQNEQENIENRIGQSSAIKNVVNEEKVKSTTSEIPVVPTLLDNLDADSIWCSTFQLVWNDMQNEIVGGNVVFTPQLDIVKNLNQQTFKEKDLSPEYYYKKFGLKTLELKSEIEQGIKEKFNETSDILDKLDWSEDALNDENKPNINRYLFYAMLKREFKFPKEFDILEKGKFENKYENIEYFGITEETNEKVRDQVDVLYYNSNKDFAVILNTESQDQVILVRNAEGNNFDEIYSNVNDKAVSYRGSQSFGDEDTLKVPNLNINVFKQYKELEGKSFKTKLGEGEIQAAIQSIKLKLDNSGGSIKSEAVIDMVEMTAMIPEDNEEKREFNFDGKFTIFLKEAEKDIPYFASNIENITLFQ